MYPQLHAAGGQCRAGGGVMTAAPRRAAIYARVSTLDQEPENQLAELRRYVAARGWTAVEFVDRGVSLGVGTVDRPSMPF